MSVNSCVLWFAYNPTKAQSRQHFPKKETLIKRHINFNVKITNKGFIRSKQRFRITKMEWWRWLILKDNERK